MSKKKLFKMLLPSLVLSFATQVDAYTVHEAVIQTLATSPDLFIATTKRDQVDKEMREAYADYLPTLDMSSGWGEQYNNNSNTRVLDTLTGGRSGSLTLAVTEFRLFANQMLFDGLGVYHNVEGKKARVRAESWRVNGQAQDLALAAIEKYLDVLQARELLGVHRENVASHNRLQGQISKRSEGGIGRRADLDQADARVALSRTNMIAEEGLLLDAETEFLRTVGIPVPVHLVTPSAPHPFPASEHEAVEMGLRNHPIFLASMEDVNVTEEEHKGSKSAFVPRFDLQLEYSKNHNIAGARGPSDDAYAMVRMNWNLFRGGKDLAKYCRTAIKIQEALETENRARRQVIETVRLDWSFQATAQRAMRYFRDHVEASTRTQGAYQKQFNIGQRTLLDLLDAENELLQARLQMIQSKYNHLKGMYRVLRSTGTLTQYFHAELPPQSEPRANAIMDGRMRFFDKREMLFDN